MELKKLNPWNWFKHEDSAGGNVPIRRTGTGGEVSAFTAGAFWPSLNVSSDDNSYQVAVEVPGLGKDDVTVEVSDDILTIRGEKREESESRDRHYYRVERNYGSFQRTLALPGDALADDIKASLKDGVLNLVIPREQGTLQDARQIIITD